MPHLSTTKSSSILSLLATDEAEIHDGAGWRPIGIAEGLDAPKGTVMRCPSCGGRVRAHREGTTAQRAHFEHYQRHDGARRSRGSRDRRRGTRTR